MKEFVKKKAVIVKDRLGLPNYMTMFYMEPGTYKEEDVADNFPYVEGQPAEIYFDGKWHRGKIIAGYRFRDGIVTVQTEDGKKIWCGESRKELYRAL